MGVVLDDEPQVTEETIKQDIAEEIGYEFPELRETSEIDDVGFFEGLIPNLKLMMVRDDNTKAEVMKRSFGDDKRFGGVFSDEYDNPIIVWNNEPYYVNKPGISGTDIGTFAGEVIKFLPASKYVGGAKTLGGTIARGVAGYTGTEVASQAIEKAVAPESAKKKSEESVLKGRAEDVAKSVGVGVATDVALPPAARIVGKGLRQVVDPIAKGISEKLTFPKFEKVDLVEDEVPLTLGQETRDPEILTKEDIIRGSSVSSKAKDILVNFDEIQLNQVKKMARNLQEEFGTGQKEILDSGDPVTASAETIQDIASSRAKQLKKQSKEGYTEVKEAVDVDTGNPFVVANEEGSKDVAVNIINNVRKEQIDSDILQEMPLLSKELSRLERVVKTGKWNADKKGVQDLNDVWRFQKNLNILVRKAEAGSDEKRILGIIKNDLDNAVYENVDNAFLTGDLVYLDKLKNATGLYRQYLGLTGKATAKDPIGKSANKILQKITNPDYSPQDVATALFGHAKFNTKSEMKQVINILKRGLPKEEAKEVMTLLKDAVLEKAFTNPRTGQVTRKNIIDNYRQVFEKNKFVIDELFSAEEIARIKAFRDKVVPSLDAELRQNPSGSAYTMISALQQSGILSFTRAVPFLRDIKIGAGEMADISAAENSVKQYIKRKQMPLFSVSTQSIIRNQTEKEPALPEDTERFDEDKISAVQKPMKVASSPTAPDVNILLQSENAQQAMAQGAKDMGMAPMPLAPMPTAQAPMPPQGGLANLQQAQQFGALFPQDSMGQLIAQGKPNV
tara:strand:- start:204 stop:2570 length:2367 start_codon:yes stop_codon:yes gene_type:complete